MSFVYLKSTCFICFFALNQSNLLKMRNDISRHIADRIVNSYETMPQHAEKPTKTSRFISLLTTFEYLQMLNSV